MQKIKLNCFYYGPLTGETLQKLLPKRWNGCVYIKVAMFMLFSCILIVLFSLFKFLWLKQFLLGLSNTRCILLIAVLRCLRTYWWNKSLLYSAMVFILCSGIVFSMNIASVITACEGMFDNSCFTLVPLDSVL